MGINIEIHSVDDWEALYVDGKCHSQGQPDRLEEFILAHFLGRDNPHPMTIDSVTHEYHEGDAVHERVTLRGRFPETLEELKGIKKNRLYAAVPRGSLNGNKASLEDYYVITADTAYLWTALKEINPPGVPAIVEFESFLDPNELTRQMEMSGDWEVDQIL